MTLRQTLIASLTVMAVSVGSAAAAPITYLGILQPGVPVVDANTQGPGNQGNPEGADYWRFFANAGDPVTVFGDRLVGAYDMAFWVFQGTYTDTNDFGPSFDAGDPGFADFGDDEDPANIAGPFGDPRSVFNAPSTGWYTVAVTNFLSGAVTQGGYPYQLEARGTTAVPEPASMLLVGSGLLGLACQTRRRKRMA